MTAKWPALAALALVACSAGEADPSKGTYTVLFPSTAAAVATDYVQILVFDVKTPAERTSLCQDLVIARSSSPDTLVPSTPPSPATNICEMRAGQRSVTVPYGEHAVVAIAQRKDEQDQLKDFLVGCTIMTIGNGDAPLPIALKLVSVNTPVPATSCGSVGEFCAGKCD